MAEAAASRWGTAAKKQAQENSRRERVLILGGGFGGLYTALRLSQLPKKSGSLAPIITLVDKRDKFVFTPLLYELAGECCRNWIINALCSSLKLHSSPGSSTLNTLSMPHFLERSEQSKCQ